MTRPKLPRVLEEPKAWNPVLKELPSWGRYCTLWRVHKAAVLRVRALKAEAFEARDAWRAVRETPRSDAARDAWRRARQRVISATADRDAAFRARCKVGTVLRREKERLQARTV